MGYGLFEEIILLPASVASLAYIESSLYRWIILLDKYKLLYPVDRNEDILSIINSRLSERASIMPFM